MKSAGLELAGRCEQDSLSVLAAATCILEVCKLSRRAFDFIAM